MKTLKKFAGFDNTCDLSAVLGILANAACFDTAIQGNAKDVRSKVRNEWGHCNFDHWKNATFVMCFQVMETMIRSLRLAKADEEKHVDYLKDWQTKGLFSCFHRISVNLLEGVFFSDSSPRLLLEVFLFSLTIQCREQGDLQLTPNISNTINIVCFCFLNIALV